MALQMGFDASAFPLALPRNTEGQTLFDGFALEPKNPVTVTPNELTFTTVSPATTIWKGSNFEVSEDNVVVGGEVTEILVKFGEQMFYELTELEGIDAAELFSLSIVGEEDPVDPLFDYLLQGDDTSIGTNLDDDINGRGGNDTIFGRAGNDTLTGGIGQDLLFGGGGDDTLIGIEPLANGTTGEIDILNGGNGQDTFVLGDGSSITYYAEGGDSDYAIIEDFANDVFQLGSTNLDNYEVDGDLTIDGRSGARILFNGDLIAIVEGVSANDFSLGDFI